MANRNTTVLLKRSNVLNKVPDLSGLTIGELALNTADAKLYTLYTSGTGVAIEVKEIGWDKIPSTGNTSGNCITDLYVSNINSCSPLHIQNISSGDVLIGENGGINLGIGTPTPTEKLEVSGKTKTINLQITSGATNGYILSSDAIGNASWIPQSGGFSGGTVPGPTNFTGGLSANTISATTYFNLPINNYTYVSGSTYSATTIDNVIGVDSSISATTIYLPNSVSSGRLRYDIKDVGLNSSNNNITIISEGSDTIISTENSNTVILSSDGGALIFFNTGTGTWLQM